MKLKEKVFEIMPMQEYTDKNGELRQNRDLVLITDEQWPKKIACTFQGAHCNLLNAVQTDDIVEVSCDISSAKSESTGRYFTTITAWSINIVQRAEDKKTQANTAAPTAPTAPAAADGNVIYPQ